MASFAKVAKAAAFESARDSRLSHRRRKSQGANRQDQLLVEQMRKQMAALQQQLEKENARADAEMRGRGPAPASGCVSEEELLAKENARVRAIQERVARMGAGGCLVAGVRS